MTATSSSRSCRFALAVIGLLCLSVGCGQSASSEYKAYSEFDRPSDVSGDLQSEAISEESSSNPSADDVGVSTDATTEAGTIDAAASNPEGESASPAVDVGIVTANEDASHDGSPGSSESGETTTETTFAVEAPKPTPPKRVVQVLVPNQTFVTEGPEDAIRVSYDDIDLLKVLNMEPVTADAADLMPNWLKQLDGRRIRIRGYMFPQFMETGIRGFALARDNQICCFVRTPKIYDVFDVYMREGHTTDYIQNRPFDVAGVFHIHPQIDGGEMYQLYVIDDAVVVD